MMTYKQWRDRTSVVGHLRSKELQAVDQKFEAYSKLALPKSLNELCDAVEAWSKAKGGYAALLKGIRNRKSAVQELVTELRQKAKKDGSWPDAKGSSYVAKVDTPTRELLLKMRAKATAKSIEMIAAMNVDWVALGWEQAGSFASTGIGLGQMNYKSGWNNAKDNLNTGGYQTLESASKLMSIVLDKANEKLVEDPRVEQVLKGAQLSTSIALGVLKQYLFKDGVLSKVAPLIGPIKEAVDSVAKGAVELRLARKSAIRVEAARRLVDSKATSAQALDAFQTLLQIETAKSVGNLVYRLIKNTALVVTEVLTLGAMTIVQVVTALVEVIVGFVYQLVYSLVFKAAVTKCRNWVSNGSLPTDLNFGEWIAACPLLGAYFIAGMSAGGGSVSTLAMFQNSSEICSTDFQDASVKLLRARQAAGAYIKESPVKVKWTGPNGEKFKWIDSLVESDALSASVGLNLTKIHHWHLSENASVGSKIKHRFYQGANNAWSVGKTGWSLI